MPFVQDPETAYSSTRPASWTSWARSSSRPRTVAQSGGKPGFKQVPQFFDAYIGFNNAKAPLDNVSCAGRWRWRWTRRRWPTRCSAAAVVATDHIVPPGMPGYFDGLKPLTFDAAAAKQELAERVRRRQGRCPS